MTYDVPNCSLPGSEKANVFEKFLNLNSHREAFLTSIYSASPLSN